MNFFDIVLIQPIFNLLIALYSIIPFGDFGLALIVFTIIVRLAMWPLIKKQLHQSRIMRKLQPELAKIKKNSNGNRQLESMQMLELYKKHDVNPLRSIGVLLIQLPIFIALYTVINIFTVHRDQVGKYTYDILEGIGPIHNIVADPSKFNETLFGFVNLTKSALGSTGIDMVLLFALALAAAYAQRVMTKQTMPNPGPKKKLRDIMSQASGGKQPAQAEINNAVMGKMASFLPIMMFFIMIGLPGALALYYAASNIVAVIQQRNIFKDDVDEMEDIADKVIEKSKKESSAKDRAKSAKEANVTRIVATDTRKKK